MTLEQVRTINNAMSFLTQLREVSRHKEYLGDCWSFIETHRKAMEEAGVDTNIIEHFGIIAEGTIIGRDLEL